MLINWRREAGSLLYMTEVDQKLDGVFALYNQVQQVALPNDRNGGVLLDIKSARMPGRPKLPFLVPPGDVRKRKAGSEEGRRILVHAIAHIEFNAVNLALDALYRFDEMPLQYYLDWLSVAKEEAEHFGMLRARLEQFDSFYGAYPAHNGLWDMAVDTAHDVLVRMALVPRVLEARGLDITPSMITQLEKAGDSDTVAILHVILKEEVGHVKIGSHWFHHMCEKRGVEPVETFLALIREYMAAPPKTPFNEKARAEGGFSDSEIAELVELEKEWLAEIKNT